MKKLFSKLKKNPMLFVFIIILLCFTPAAMFSPGESNNRAIVTAIGIDKENDEYEVSLLTFIPTPNQTYLETNSVVSSKGSTLAEAIAKTELTLGKRMGLSHAKTTVISTSLLKDDVSKDIDYLGRVASLSENTILICTDATAKEFLLAAQLLEKDIGTKLDKLISYNIDNIYVTDTSLEAFFKGYFSANGSSLIGFLSIEEVDSTGKQKNSSGDKGEEDSQDMLDLGEKGDTSYSSSQPSSSGGAGGAGGSGGSSNGENSQGQKKIFNKGEVVLIKDGVMVAKLDDEQLYGINVLNDKAINRNIRIENVTDEVYNNATLTYQVKNKKVRTATKFENGIPVFSADVVLGLEIVEAKEGEKSLVTNTELNDIPYDVALRIEQYVKKGFADTLKLLRKNKTDVIGITQKFEAENRENFRKFLESLDDPDDFLNFIKFQLIVRVQSD